MVRGTVFNIQKFSINDGPGIRTTVFLKGCPLNCIWCHNPESKSAEEELFYNFEKCIGCGRCAAVCPQKCHTFEDGRHIFNREKCIVCGKCAEECYTGALETVGYVRTVEEIITEVLKDRDFYENSGGGMTVSGGEPMMQFDFTYSLFKAAKEAGLHTCIETCGFAPKENFKKLAQYVDIFLFDCKETDSRRHKEYTGVPNESIKENIKMLDEMGSKIILRCPIIPTLNDRQDHFEAIAELAESLNNIIEVNIEPYHPLGSSKAMFLGKKYVLEDLSFPDNETVNRWIEIISSKKKVRVTKA